MSGKSSKEVYPGSKNGHVYTVLGYELVLIRAVVAGLKEILLHSNSCYGQKGTFRINEDKNVFLFQLKF